MKPYTAYQFCWRRVSSIAGISGAVNEFKLQGEYAGRGELRS